MDIYPDVLNLKKTSDNKIINFLDLCIKIVDNSCQFGISDKRNFQLKSLANWNSNLSKRIFKNIIVSQMSRIIYSNSEKHT